jgi:CO/xanthine dehydrogenase Mo-binding subunit
LGSDRLPGVESIITAAEVPAMPPAATSIAARHLFARGEVRCVGDMIAAVLPITLEKVLAALRERTKGD